MKLGNASKPPNILIILTDQQRQFRHWPEGWAEKNLPSFGRLAKNGLTFERAFTNACMCAPSRATLWTSLFPSETNVRSTNGNALSPGMLTLGQVLTSAGYQVGYCGKWHLQGYEVPEAEMTGDSLTRYGFGRWNPPDAGDSLTEFETLGAGKHNNDARYLGTVSGSAENPPGVIDSGPSMIKFLQTVDRSKPFCLIACFVNPHDIFVAPFRCEEAGYDPSQWKDLPIPVPGTWDENLTTKPRVQAEYKNTLQLPNTPNVSTWSDADRKAYVQFYAYLQQVVDRDIMTLLDTVDSEGFTDNTLIFRMADHGEMALSHGLLEKTYNAYDETINVPLIISNPQLFPSPVVTRELAGHIDLLPTVASVAGVLDQYKHKFKGIDLSPLFTAPDQSLQEAIHFTFDDKGMEPLIKISSDTPRYIRALRTKDWLYAAYYGYTKGGPVFDYELYDLENDPDEKINLAHPVHSTPESKQKLRDMNTQLIKAMYTYGTTPRGFDWPKVPDVTPAEQARP